MFYGTWMFITSDCSIQICTSYTSCVTSRVIKNGDYNRKANGGHFSSVQCMSHYSSYGILQSQLLGPKQASKSWPHSTVKWCHYSGYILQYLQIAQNEAASIDDPGNKPHTPRGQIRVSMGFEEAGHTGINPFHVNENIL